MIRKGQSVEGKPMRSFSLAGSLMAVLLAGAAVPAVANTATIGNGLPPAKARIVVADESSPAGMQERSRRNDVDSDETAPDDADAQDQSDNDEVDSGPYADRGSDSVAPDEDYGPDERGYGAGPESGPDSDAPHEGYEDGDRGGQSDEDDDDQDDDSGFHWA
jgi:hypothetical protein